MNIGNPSRRGGAAIASLDCRQHRPHLLNRKDRDDARPHNRGNHTRTDQYYREILGRPINDLARDFRHKFPGPGATQSIKHLAPVMGKDGPD